MLLQAEEHTADNRGVENQHGNRSTEFKSLPAHQVLADYDLAPSSWNAYSNSWLGLVSKSGILFRRPGTVRRVKSSACMLFFKSLGDNGNETGAPGSGLRENGAAMVFCKPFWKEST